MGQKRCTSLFWIGAVGVFVSFGFSFQSALWHKESRGIGETDIRCLATHPNDPSVVYAGTENGVYRSTNQGRDFRSVFYTSGETKNVNFIYISSSQPHLIFAATDNGLYVSHNEGENWKRVFSSSKTESSRCLSFMEHNGRYFLGTGGGLWTKTKADWRWKIVDPQWEDEAIYFVAGDQEHIYFSTYSDVYKLNPTDLTYEKIFSIGLNNEIEANGETVFFDSPEIKSLAVLRKESSIVMAATTQGIFLRTAAQGRWDRFPADNVPFDSITSWVIQLDSKGLKTCSSHLTDCVLIFLGTSKGAYRYKDGKWASVYQGLETNMIYDLTEDIQGRVYAATNKGVFYFSDEKAVSSTEKNQNLIVDYASIEDIFSYEPTIHAVHQLAVKYAEVEPEKIQSWREGARKRAWLPQLDIGYDAGYDQSLSDSIFGSSSGNHHIAPDDKSNGRDHGWDISLSWDLADLIWSSDQTSIDSRSKLMVELREDILDQVTRLFFERRRLQIEMISMEPLEAFVHIEKEMRIAELTAQIDAYTGGAFSRRILSGRQKPEKGGKHDVRDKSSQDL